MDRWQKLWEYALSDESAEDPGRIEIDPETSERVAITWPDGSVSDLEWRNNEWVALSKGPPYDAATATGMYDRDF